MKRNLLIGVLCIILIATNTAMCFASGDGSSLKGIETVNVRNGNDLFYDSDGNFCVTQTWSEADLLKNEAKKTVSELKDAGYSSDEIEEIKNPVSPFDAKEKYGNVSYTIKYYKDSFKYSDGITYIKTNVSWSWSKTPVIVKTDLIGMTTSAAFAKYGKSSAHINYYKDGNKTAANKKIVNKTVKTKSSGEGTYIKIPMATTFEGGNNVYYGLGGSMTVNWRTSGNIKTVGLSGNYGHTKLSCTPSISFGNGVLISFSPKSKISYGDEAYINVKR
ncbi:MAG: hypothetical protein MR884_01495 [Clostridiales bacterium]|nr:hypothetical protein [Clostridiales bacterium]